MPAAIIERSASITHHYMKSTGVASTVPATRGKRDRSPTATAAAKKTATAEAKKNKKSSTSVVKYGHLSSTGPVTVRAQDHPWWSRVHLPKQLQQSDDYPGMEVGAGVFGDEFRQIIRETPNDSECFYCPSQTCDCEEICELLKETYANLSTKRIVTVAGKRHLCAKSMEQNFVARATRRLEVTAEDTFYDLGSGNGSVLFQVAYLTGAKCIGVELDQHNANLSREAWAVLKPKMTKMAKAKGRTMGDIEFITGDLCKYISEPHFAATGKSVIWTSNLLMPKSVTHVMATRFQLCLPGTRIACFDDLYPHSRESSRSMYPELFRLFAMEDYTWPPGAVEWCINEGPWYIHRRTSYVSPPEESLEDAAIVVS